MIEKISTKLFGKLIEPYLDQFEPLKLQLKHAQIKLTLHEYLSNIVFFSFLAFAVSLMLTAFFVTLATSYSIYSYTLAVIVSFGAFALTFLMGHYYPNMKASNIKNSIDKSLPFTTIYMATAASAEINPVQIFEIISLRSGEIGNECKRIYRDIKMLGMDLSTALSKAANRTPSPRLAELLWGMMSVIERGGNLGGYLSDKARAFMDEYRRSLDNYSRQVSFYTEIYVTLIIVGSLFFIVLTSIMSPLVGGDILALQTLLVFIFIPLISVGFIVLLRSLSPGE